MISRSMSAFSIVSKASFPFREPASPPSNSIQPSLKPSSIRMRGVGFFMPCDLNSCSHVSRGTGSMLTRRPSTSAKVCATSSGVTRRDPSNSMTLRPIHDSWSSFAASRRFIQRLQEAHDDPALSRRGDIPARILLEPCGSKESNRHRQLSQSLLNDGVLCKQVGFTRLGTDRRQVYDSARICSFQRRLQGSGRRPRLRKTGSRIEVRRNQHEDSFCAFEGRSQRRGIGDIRLYDFANALCPDIPFVQRCASRRGQAARRPEDYSRCCRQTSPVIPVNCVHCIFSLRITTGSSCFPSA